MSMNHHYPPAMSQLIQVFCVIADLIKRTIEHRH